MINKATYVITASLIATLWYGQSWSEETPSPQVPVNLMNNRNVSIYVGFTVNNPDQAPGPITWQSGCADTGGTTNASYARIDPGKTCTALVDPNSFPENGLMTGSSRFCARIGNESTSAPNNCMEAQEQFLTIIETTFQPYVQPDKDGKNGKCFNNQSCVWYDVSVIPDSITGDAFKCTDAAWASNKCGNSGPASYNLPVQLLCSANPTYTCQGPPNGTNGKPRYPSNCGDPNAVCNGNKPECLNAYFYPMSTKLIQPNSVCPNGNTLNVHFLAGP